MQTDGKKMIKVIGFSIFFLFVIVYALFISRDLISGVKIKDVNLIDGSTYTENVIKVTGNAEHAIKLTLNGREISVDQEGNFSETIALLLGYNIINITAQDKFGYMDEKNYQLIYKNND